MNINSINGIEGQKRVNIAVIVIDTLRKDYARPLEDLLVSKYGFIAYDKVVAPAPWTVPSHASMFTGLYPSLHRSHETLEKKIPYVTYKSSNMLAKKIKTLGYRTCLLTANPLVHPRLGLDGFDCVREFELYPKRPLSYYEIKIIRDLRREFGTEYSKIKLMLTLLKKGYLLTALKLPVDKIYRMFWLRFNSIRNGWPRDKGASYLLKIFNNIIRNNKDRNSLFVFLNLMEVHEPYGDIDIDERVGAKTLSIGRPPEEVLKLWRKRYPEQVKYITEKIKETFDNLEDLGVLSEMLIIVTSDHGQLLGERNRIGHGLFLDDELLFVPFLIKYPSTMKLQENTDLPKEKWLSLTKLKDIINSIVFGVSDWHYRLYQDTVYAESYGLIWDYRPFLSSEELIKLKEKYERYRVAVYYKSYKGIFDTRLWDFVDLRSYKGSIDNYEKIILKKKIIKFISQITMLSKLRKNIFTRKNDAV